MKTHRIKRVLVALLLAANANLFYAMENAETLENIIAKAMKRFESDDFRTLPADLIAQYSDPNMKLLDRICREKNPALSEHFFTIKADSEQARYLNFKTAFSQYNALLWEHLPPSAFNADTAQETVEDAVANILALLQQYNYPTLPDHAMWELSTDNLRILDKICSERNPDAAQEFFLVPCANELERFKNIGSEYNRYVALLSKYMQAPSDASSLLSLNQSPVSAEQNPSPSQEMEDQSPWIHTCDVTDTEIILTIVRNPRYQDSK